MFGEEGLETLRGLDPIVTSEVGHPFLKCLQVFSDDLTDLVSLRQGCKDLFGSVITPLF
jgi:hypothetical protein